MVLHEDHLTISSGPIESPEDHLAFKDGAVVLLAHHELGDAAILTAISLADFLHSVIIILLAIFVLAHARPGYSFSCLIDSSLALLGDFRGRHVMVAATCDALLAYKCDPAIS